MRISKTLVPVALAALLAACSNEEEIANYSSNTAILDEGNVEIKLSTGGPNRLTRSLGAIESDNQGLFDVDSMGIFMLATNETKINKEAKPLVWNAEVNPWAVWMDNVDANAVTDAGGTRTEIRWRDGQDRWYPIGNWYSYRFYGYHPTKGAQLISTNKRRTIRWSNLDGMHDIIYGRSKGAIETDEYEKYRYSARYFRQRKVDEITGDVVKNFSDSIPTLQMEHKLMRLQFCIVGLPDSNMVGREFESANNMMVDTIQITHVPTSAELIIADFDDNTQDGKITYDWTNATANDFIDVKDMNFGLLSASDSINTFNTTYNRYEGRRVHNNDTVYVGQSILMPVPDEAATTSGHTSFQVNVMLRNTDGIALPAEQPMDLQLKNYAAFKSGYTYRVILNIAGPRLVTLRAVLEPWKNAWEDENEQGFESLIFN